MVGAEKIYSADFDLLIGQDDRFEALVATGHY